MCNITGMICAAFSLVLLMKYVARRRNMKKLNILLAKCHKEVGILFVVFAILHTVFSVPKLAENGIIMIFFGSAGLLAGVVLAVSGYMIKRNCKALRWHRWSSIAYAVCMVLHMFR